MCTDFLTSLYLFIASSLLVLIKQKIKLFENVNYMNLKNITSFGISNSVGIGLPSNILIYELPVILYFPPLFSKFSI